MFMESYFASQKDQIFRNVEVLIYIFDIESREMEKDLKNANKKVQDLTTQNQRMLGDFESNLVWW